MSIQIGTGTLVCGRRAVFAAVLTALALLAAGCGSSKAPSVASLGSTSTSKTSASTTAQTVSPQKATAEFVKYAACMSSNGIPTTAAPGGGLVVRAGAGGVDPSSPQYHAAQKACFGLLPKGGLPKPSQAQIAQRLAQSLKLAACMRTQGVPDFPDPNSGGGFDISASTDGGIDPSSPRFQSAQTACQAYQPGGGP